MIAHKCVIVIKQIADIICDVMVSVLSSSTEDLKVL
jgi:hypothetical protein